MLVLIAALSATFNALGSVLQSRGARSVSDRDAMKMRMVTGLMGNPQTLGGIAALTIGVCLQAAALSGAPLTLVEPLLVAELPIALVLASLLFGVRLDGRAWLGVSLTAAALAGLLYSTAPSGGSVDNSSTLAWCLLLAVAAAACAMLIVLARRLRPGPRAALLGAAAGVGHGVAATMMKAASVAGSRGAVPLLGTWQLYGTLLIGGGALYLYQNALQAGPLAAAQPALAITDPGVSATCGVLMFGEQIRTGPLAAAELACVAIIVGGVTMLARSSAAIGQRERPPANGDDDRPRGRAAREETRSAAR